MPKKKDETIEEFGAEIETEIEFSGSDIHVELTEQEKIQLEAEAKKEVAAALKASKMKEFKAAAKKRIQSESMFRNGKDDTGEDVVEVRLHLASYPKWITLDGARYYSGRVYKLRRSVASVLLDQMDRGWRQEAARTGERVENFQPVRYSPTQGLRYN